VEPAREPLSNESISRVLVFVEGYEQDAHFREQVVPLQVIMEASELDCEALTRWTELSCEEEADELGANCARLDGNWRPVARAKDERVLR